MKSGLKDEEGANMYLALCVAVSAAMKSGLKVRISRWKAKLSNRSSECRDEKRTESHLELNTRNRQIE